MPSKEAPEITKTLQIPLASPGKTIADKYKIIAEFGRGGIAEVDDARKRLTGLRK